MKSALALLPQQTPSILDRLRRKEIAPQDCVPLDPLPRNRSLVVAAGKQSTRSSHRLIASVVAAALSGAILVATYRASADRIRDNATAGAAMTQTPDAVRADPAPADLIERLRLAHAAFKSADGELERVHKKCERADGSLPSTGSDARPLKTLDCVHDSKNRERSLEGVQSQPTKMGRAELKALAARIAREEGIDPVVFDALIRTESNYDIGAVSGKGAMSLAQLMPGTAKDLGLGPADFFNPEANLRGGARYLKALLEEAGDIDLALAAYNAGLARVRERPRAEWPAETRSYVATVLKRAGKPAPRLSGQDAQPGVPNSRIGTIMSMAPGSTDDAGGAVTLAAEYAARKNR